MVHRNNAIEVLPLQEVADVISGKYSVSNLVKTDGWFVGIADIEQRGLGVAHPQELSSNLPGQGSLRQFLPGDILLATVGPVYDQVWLADREGFCPTSILVVRAKPGINSRFLLYYFLSRSFNRSVSAVRQGSTRVYITLNDLKDIDVLLPSIDKQQELVQLLDLVNVTRGLREKSIKTFENYQSSVFEYMFGDIQRSTAHGQELVLRDIADVSVGLHINMKQGTGDLTPYLTAGNVRRYMIDYSQVKSMYVSRRDRERKRLQQDDVLIVTAHGSLREIGRAAVLEKTLVTVEGHEYVHLNNTIRVRASSNNTVTPHFLSALINSTYVQKYILSSLKATSISQDVVKHIPVFVPSFLDQQRITDLLLETRVIQDRQKLQGDLLAELFLNFCNSVEYINRATVTENPNTNRVADKTDPSIERSIWRKMSKIQQNIYLSCSELGISFNANDVLVLMKQKYQNNPNKEQISFTLELLSVLGFITKEGRSDGDYWRMPERVEEDV